MNQYIKGLYVLLIGICCASPAQSQKVEFGVLVGGGTYYGDLNPRYGMRFLAPGGNILLRRNYDGRLCVKGSLAYNYLWAADSLSNSDYAKARNLSFRSHTFSGSIQLEFNFQPYHITKNQTSKEKKTSPYLSTGLSIVYFDPRADYLGGTYSLRDMGTEGQPLGSEYARVSPAWLLGGGIKADITREWSFNLEIMGHLLFTDYLDDVSRTYADYSIVEGYHGTAAAALSDRSLEAGDTRVGAAGRQRGDSRSKDAYLSINMGFVYRFMNVSCPAY